MLFAAMESLAARDTVSGFRVLFLEHSCCCYSSFMTEESLLSPATATPCLYSSLCCHGLTFISAVNSEPCLPEFTHWQLLPYDIVGVWTLTGTRQLSFHTVSSQGEFGWILSPYRNSTSSSCLSWVLYWGGHTNTLEKWSRATYRWALCGLPAAPFPLLLRNCCSVGPLCKMLLKNNKDVWDIKVTCTGKTMLIMAESPLGYLYACFYVEGKWSRA